nr:MucR family transcriptional regulator [uncultured Brevundimonas sp.]
MADEANEQKRHGLRATLEVLVERLEPVLEALNGDRTDGILPLDSDDADWFADQLTEASRWAEDALAATGAFDPLPGDEIARPSLTEPAVPIRKSITPDHIVCLEDGRKFKCLKRHLRTKYNLSPDAYRAKWGLARDYPMVAPNYAKAREDLARQMGLKAAANP